MSDRSTLLESALECMPDGLAVLDRDSGAVFWNAAAEYITGYGLGELPPGDLPHGLEPLLEWELRRLGTADAAHGALVRLRHKLGHEVLVIARLITLHNAAGELIGATVLFHPAERLDALPHGEPGDDLAAIANQAEFEERLYAEYEDFKRGGQPMGVLWIGVDQGHCLRKTHGRSACQAMIEKVQRALAAGLRPAEELARWGEDEFLILAHERSPEMLSRHARTLTGLARTADFRWWGDRVSLTVSIGAAQARMDQTLSDLLDDARKAMEDGLRAGGNRVTSAANEQDDTPTTGEDPQCTPS